MNASVIVSSETPQVGDEALLTLGMSQAASRYGVPPDVIPKRRRTEEVIYA
jgi:hypothetical protein